MGFTLCLLVHCPWPLSTLPPRRWVSGQLVQPGFSHSTQLTSLCFTGKLWTKGHSSCEKNSGPCARKNALLRSYLIRWLSELAKPIPTWWRSLHTWTTSCNDDNPWMIWTGAWTVLAFSPFPNLERCNQSAKLVGLGDSTSWVKTPLDQNTKQF